MKNQLVFLWVQVPLYASLMCYSWQILVEAANLGCADRWVFPAEISRCTEWTVKTRGMRLAWILAECSYPNHGQRSLMGCENCSEKHKVWDRQKESCKYFEVRISLSPSQCTTKYISKASLEVLPRSSKISCLCWSLAKGWLLKLLIFCSVLQFTDRQSWEVIP